MSVADAAAGAAAARNWLMMQHAGRLSGKQKTHGKNLPSCLPILSFPIMFFLLTLSTLYLCSLYFNETFHQGQGAAATSALNPAANCHGSRMVTTATAGALTKKIGLLLRTSAGIRAATWLLSSQMPPENMSSRE